MIVTRTYHKTTLGEIADNEVFYIENRDRTLSSYVRIGVSEQFHDMVQFRRMGTRARVETAMERMVVYRATDTMAATDTTA